jgi:hypothetical protein
MSARGALRLTGHALLRMGIAALIFSAALQLIMKSTQSSMIPLAGRDSHVHFLHLSQYADASGTCFPSPIASMLATIPGRSLREKSRTQAAEGGPMSPRRLW